MHAVDALGFRFRHFPLRAGYEYEMQPPASTAWQPVEGTWKVAHPETRTLVSIADLPWREAAVPARTGGGAEGRT